MPRLDVLLARNLGVSRKQVKILLRAGRVQTSAGVVLDDGSQAHPSATLPRTVVVDGIPRTLRDRFHVLQHKPLGVVTALADGRHPTAYALLSGAPLFGDLRPVGRLDKETAGLLLWTTDGTLLHRVTHPRYAVPRVYEAALAVPFAAPDDGLVLEDGHRPEILSLQAIEPRELHPATPNPDGALAHARISIVGGKFHEVRRIFAALGSRVVGLCRVAYGPLSLPPDLEAGGFVEVDLRAVFGGLHPRPRASD